MNEGREMGKGRRDDVLQSEEERMLGEDMWSGEEEVR